jgi:hypothetical protein
MSSKERPTLGGVGIKTRKRNTTAPLDPTTFADAAVQIYLKHEGNLELVAKSIESSDLDFSRYGDIFFEVVFIGGRTQPGTIKPEEGDRHPHAVLNCEPARQNILPSVLLYMNGCRKEFPVYMVGLSVSFRYEYLMRETIFSRLFLLPQPPFKIIYYTGDF